MKKRTDKGWVSPILVLQVRNACSSESSGTSCVALRAEDGFPAGYRHDNQTQAVLEQCGLRLSSASVVGNAKCLSGETGTRSINNWIRSSNRCAKGLPSQPVCAPFCGCRRALDLLIWPSLFLGSLGQTRAHPRVGDQYVSVAFVFVRSRSANDDKREEGLGETRVCHVILASRVRHCISSSSERHVKRPTMDLSCLSKAICTTVNAT